MESHFINKFIYHLICDIIGVRVIDAISERRSLLKKCVQPLESRFSPKRKRKQKEGRHLDFSPVKSILDF